MNRARSIWVFVFVAFAWLSTYAVGPVAVKQFINHKDWNFVENKGQLSASEIKYYGHQGGVYLYCKPGIISFVFTKVENKQDDISEATSQPVETQCPSVSRTGLRLNRASAMPQPPLPQDAFNASLQTKITTSRADLVLLNSNPSAEIIASGRQEYYENYYTTGNANSGITNVHTYKTITYKDIYPHIDMVLYAKESGMKYEFVVYPGGDVNDIQLQWNGLESIKKSKDSGIEYSCALGKMEESEPISFVRAGLAPAPSVNMDAENKIESHFILKNNHIGFKISKYDKTKTLVIDPTLEWGTYFGGSGEEEGLGVCCDPSGNVYITGSTNSSNQIATTGSFQSSYVGNGDVFLAKFTSSGKRLWSTYYGEGQALGICIDLSNNIYIAGNTISTSGMASSGAYQTSNAGTFNAFLAKFSGSGNRVWATYFGGNGFDVAQAVCTDISGNVFITGSTTSSTGIATTGSYQTSFSGGIGSGNVDCFIAKFNSAGALSWATYFNGNVSTDGYGVCTDGSGNVYITGQTTSNSGIATSGAYQSTYGGDTGPFDGDAFLAKFSSAGTLSWSTYFGGRSADWGYGIDMDVSGYIYITGATYSNNGIATSGAYQTSIFGITDAFLAKFNSKGALSWATYFGGSNTLAEAISTDGSGNVYIAGFTVSSNDIATTDAYQTTYGGGAYDGFLAKFTPTGVVNWATYYGGNDLDWVKGASTDIFGNVYLTGYTLSTGGIATIGSFQTFYAGNNDAFLAKFGAPNYSDVGVDSIISPLGNSCKDTIPIVVQLKNYGTDTLNSVSIISSINSKLQTPYFWSGNLYPDSTIMINIGNGTFSLGADTLKVWASEPNGGIDSITAKDTATIIIQVHSLPPANAGPDTILCYDETYTMQGSGGITYTWHPAIYLSSANDPNAIAILPNTERYELIVSNAYGCTDSAPVLLKVRPKLAVKAIANPASVCYGQTVILSAQGSGGDSLHYQYQWVNDNQTGDSVIEKPIQSGWHKIILSDNCSAANATDSVYVTVIPPARAAFVYVPAQLVKVNQNVNFQNQSSSAASYLWNFGANDTSNIVSPDHIYTDSGDYKITLIAYGLNHCPNDTAYGFIKIIGTQITIYIPNAFSPNGDGINDVFEISGTGIQSYSYNIYNRWGEHIFASPLPSPGGDGKGWDGNFEGVPVPEGVYIYMFDVTDFAGQHHYVSGNVTLMR